MITTNYLQDSLRVKITDTSNIFRYYFYKYIMIWLFFFSKCTHIILDNADVLSQYQLNSIQKNHIHITNPDFIWESIKERRLLDVTNYDPHKSPDITPPPCQKASSSGKYFISST